MPRPKKQKKLRGAKTTKQIKAEIDRLEKGKIRAIKNFTKDIRALIGPEPVPEQYVLNDKYGKPMTKEGAAKTISDLEKISERYDTASSMSSQLNTLIQIIMDVWLSIDPDKIHSPKLCSLLEVIEEKSQGIVAVFENEADQNQTSPDDKFPQLVMSLFEKRADEAAAERDLVKFKIQKKQH